MSTANTPLSSLDVVLTAHRDPEQSLLLATVTAHEAADAAPRTPLQVALVIDRSGSMSGEKLAITQQAVAQFIRSLAPDDRVAVVVYDDSVDVVCGLVAPSEDLARRIERVQAGGSTDLYGGWVTGAKIVGPGGRVILLSDGLANRGRFTDAASLAANAAHSYREFDVTTTTIGVGRDYDEALMAGMAREGGGAHYFAHDVKAITDAFSQERFSAESIVLSGVQLSVGDQTVELDSFWGGECKSVVLQVVGLPELATLRYTERANDTVHANDLTLPTAFGYSEEARLQYLVQEAAQAEADMLCVRDPRSAGEMKERLRAIVLKMLEHPSSDEPTTAATIDRLRASMERLEQLERHYSEQEATIHRKRSMQSSHNLRESAKAFSSFEEDRAFVEGQVLYHRPSSAAPVELRFDREALSLAPIEQWRAWGVLPIAVDPHVVRVAMENPRDGFLLSEMRAATGRNVKGVFARMSSDELVRMLV